jgi:hypothetical protein
MSTNPGTTTAHGTNKTLGIDATPEHAGKHDPMTLKFVFDEHGGLSTIQDGEGKELGRLTMKEKIERHGDGVKLVSVIPMTLIMHTNLNGEGKVCCIPVAGGWRYINC